MPYYIQPFNLSKSEGCRNYIGGLSDKVEMECLTSEWNRKLLEEKISYIYIQNPNPIENGQKLVSRWVNENKEIMSQWQSELKQQFFIIYGQEIEEEFKRKYNLLELPKNNSPRPKNILSEKTEPTFKMPPWLKTAMQPGTWVFLALLTLILGSVLGIFAVALPAFLGAATILFSAAALVFSGLLCFDYHQKLKNIQNLESARLGLPQKHIKISLIRIAVVELVKWFKNHPAQVAVVSLALTLFVIALVLTIGFFTGGIAIAATIAGGVALSSSGAFAFMAPLFSTIASGIALSTLASPFALAVMSAIAMVMAPLNLGNLAKRLLSWLQAPPDEIPEASDDSMKPVQPMGRSNPEQQQITALYTALTWKDFFTAADNYGEQDQRTGALDRGPAVR